MLNLLKLSALSWVTQVTAQICFKEKRETSDQSGAQDMTKSLRSNTPKMLQRAYMLTCLLRAQTCSALSLRILMWNASYVQKHSCSWPDRTGSAYYHRHSHCCWKPILLEGSVHEKHGFGLLRLAPCHVCRIDMITVVQVHQGDQPRFPPSCIAFLACFRMMATCSVHQLKIWQETINLSHQLGKR